MFDFSEIHIYCSQHQC